MIINEPSFYFLKETTRCIDYVNRDFRVEICMRFSLEF